MQVYRISVARWANQLAASGYAARWNSQGRFVIYTADSRALACLENVVHRSGEGLNQLFKVMTIQLPDHIAITHVKEDELPENWSDYRNYAICQQIGDKWLDEHRTAILRVPSAIIPDEHNYLLNPAHPDFNTIKLLNVEDFLFDHRIKKE
ncbi:MAG: RES family NAD+ phosphorylase [Spirosomataceae bacterium]